MAFTDPTGGVGYAFGERLSSTHMTTIAIQQPRAMDGTSGGTYVPTADVVIQGATYGLRLDTDNWIKLASRDTIYMIPLSSGLYRMTNFSGMGTADYDTGRSGGSFSTGAVTSVYSNATNQPLIAWHLDPYLRDGDVIKTLTLTLNPAGAGAAPSILPTLELGYAAGLGSYSTLTAATDAGGGSYRNVHTIAASPNYTVDRSSLRYIIAQFKGEAGTNATVGCDLTELRMVVTRTKMTF